MRMEDLQQANQESRDAWNQNAAYWDERMGEGNDFVEVLIWPPTERLLQLRPGERVLDIACGNGLTSRRLAAAGAQVVAFDFSEEMIAHARRRSTEYPDRISYHVLDATDEAALLALGEGSFDAALCNMALFDMAEIRPLMHALSRLLRPGGHFVFSVIHPCFNHPHMAHMAEMEDRGGEIVTIYSVKVFGYMSSSVARGAAIRGQPRPQLYFHRPLQVLLGGGFGAGFMLDGLEERAFPPDHPPGLYPLSWGANFSEIPPVLVARMRLPGKWKGKSMSFPALSDEKRLSLLQIPKGKIQMVLDTDTFNEIDDQFALVYTLLSKERLDLEAVYAAPFHNQRSSGPEDGMLKSYDEILRVLERLGHPHQGYVHKGSTRWLSDPAQPVPSPAVDDLVTRAKAEREGPLYVVAIGAITNVASAILTAPEIMERIVVVWLAGNPSEWHRAIEFNLMQDMVASSLIFDCGVPLVHIPCINVTEHLLTTEAEIERFVKGRGAIGDYLYRIYADYYPDHYARSKEIWDVGPIAWLVNPDWVDTTLVHSPILTSQQTWSHDTRRHFIRQARSLKRDAIFADLFRKIEGHIR
jgi:purine nucleosidase